MKFGIFTVSMPDYEPEKALEVAAELGYDGLEWRVVKDEGDRAKPSFWSGNRTSMTAEELIANAAALKSKAASCKMEMPSLGTYIDCHNLEIVELSMKAAAAIGAKSLRIGTGAYKPESGAHREQMARAKAQYAKVAELAGKYGVKALIETHMGLITPSVSLAASVLEGLSPEKVGIMWDPGNQLIEGRETYRMAIDIAGPYLAEVHVKNCFFEEFAIAGGTMQWRPHWCQIQLGVVNWREAVAELKQAGYSGWLMFEDFSTELPLSDRLKNNIAYFKSIL